MSFNPNCKNQVRKTRIKLVLDEIIHWEWKSEGRVVQDTGSRKANGCIETMLVACIIILYMSKRWHTLRIWAVWEQL